MTEDQGGTVIMKVTVTGMIVIDPDHHTVTVNHHLRGEVLPILDWIHLYQIIDKLTVRLAAAEVVSF